MNGIRSYKENISEMSFGFYYRYDEFNNEDLLDVLYYMMSIVCRFRMHGGYLFERAPII